MVDTHVSESKGDSSSRLLTEDDLLVDWDDVVET